MKKMLFVIVVFFLLFYLGCGKKEKRELRPETFKGKVGKVEKRFFSSEESFAGTIKSKNSVNISTKMMGRILKLYVDAGDFVKKGQALVEVDAAEAFSGYKQSEAGLFASETNLKNAEKDYERFKRLYEERAVTKHQLEQVEAGLAQARAQKEQAKANLEMSKTLLSYGKIYSPTEGVISKKWVEEGNIVAPGMPILTVENPSSLELSVEVPEEKAEKIAIGSKAKVFYSNDGNYKESKVTASVKTADAFSKTSTVKLEIKPEDFKAGQFVKVRFDSLGGETLSAPKNSIKKEGQIEMVFVRDNDGKVSLRVVRSGREEGDFVQILSGLSEGEIVVLNPPELMKDGDILEVSND
ncbi:MAG: efflux RND transporter periplasmic adaptor subunit [Acidobacteria bacterium]|nr:efflux RND transporter periplasmic adaptor subunit [Acidobacteriota bacterium]